MIEKVLDSVGFFAPFLLIISTVLLLWSSDKSTYLVLYLVGVVFNSLVNIILKALFQQPRPQEDKKMFHTGKRMAYDKYGMPSGHAQSTLYSTIFVHFVLKNGWITAAYLCISLISLFQRFKYKNHTILQLILGAMVGSVVGYTVFRYGQNLLKK
jgi:membrane-associated phospholipid phosphatase